jgi:hypothetical protein
MATFRALTMMLVLSLTLLLGACSANMGRGAAVGAAGGAGLGALGVGDGILSNAVKGAAVGAAGGFIYDRL